MRTGLISLENVREPIFHLPASFIYTSVTIKGLCKAGTVLEGYATQGGVERDGVLFVMEGEKRRAVQLEVRKWLQQIGVMKVPLR